MFLSLEIVYCLVMFCSLYCWVTLSMWSWVPIWSRFALGRFDHVSLFEAELLSHSALWTVCSRFSLWSQVAPWGLRPKTQLCARITSWNLHRNSTGCYVSEALKRLGYWQPHGWSHLDHDSLYGQVSLVTLLSLEPRCCFDHLLLFGPFLSLELGRC